MTDSLAQLTQILEAEDRVAMATLVATRGTTPKKEGAKMWVGADGAIRGSVTIGGCVDARVIKEADGVLVSRKPVFLTMSLGEEEAWDLGLSCAGDVDVLVESVGAEADDPIRALHRRIAAEVDQGRGAARLTRLGGEFERAVVLEDGSVEGTLGSEALDSEAADVAVSLIRRGVSRTVELGGGDVKAFCDVSAPPATVMVFGATEVAIHLVVLAREVGFRTVVVDGRSRFANRERFPTADRLVVGMPSEVVGELDYTARTFVILLAHDYKYDIPVLKAVLKTDVPYIGLLGSSRRGAAIKDFLVQDDVAPTDLERVRVPAGLDIGAEDAPAIALSILAEAMAEAAGKEGGFLRNRRASQGPPS